MAKHMYRYLSPAEIHFYGLRETARFITTQKLKYKIAGHSVTVPLGFVADGLDLEGDDFCTKPAWMAYEYVYATHSYERGTAKREQVDVFLFNNYASQLQVRSDELILGDTRISGEDLWVEAQQRGFCVCPEIVKENIVSGLSGSHKVDFTRIGVIAGVTVFAAIGLSYGLLAYGK